MAGPQWRDIGVNLNGAGSMFSGASGSYSNAGNVFIRIADQLRQRDQDKLNLAFRERALQDQNDYNNARLELERSRDQRNFDYRTNQDYLNNQAVLAQGTGDYADYMAALQGNTINTNGSRSTFTGDPAVNASMSNSLFSRMPKETQDYVNRIYGSTDPVDTSKVNPSILSKVQEASARYGVNPDTALRIMMAESNGNPNAVSPAGAQGLYQLMPGTAKELGVTDPYNIDQNIDAGIRYFAQQQKRFGDDRLASAAYNWGPGNVNNLRGGGSNSSIMDKGTFTDRFVQDYMAQRGIRVPSASVSKEANSLANDAYKTYQDDALRTAGVDRFNQLLSQFNGDAETASRKLSDEFSAMGYTGTDSLTKGIVADYKDARKEARAEQERVQAVQASERENYIKQAKSFADLEVHPDERNTFDREIAKGGKALQTLLGLKDSDQDILKSMMVEAIKEENNADRTGLLPGMDITGDNLIELNTIRSVDPIKRQVDRLESLAKTKGIGNSSTDDLSPVMLRVLQKAVQTGMLGPEVQQNLLLNTIQKRSREAISKAIEPSKRLSNSQKIRESVLNFQNR